MTKTNDESIAPLSVARDCAGRDWTGSSLPELSHALGTLLLLESSPVGVRIIRTAEEFADCPFSVPRMPLHYCSAVKFAGEGASLKMALADMDCDTAPRTLGLEAGLMDPEFVQSYVDGGLYDDTARAEEILSGVVTLEDVAGVALGPLDAFSDAAPPDVVIVPTLPYGAMRLAQAASFTGNRVHSSAIGMHGICSECTAAPFTTRQICTSLLCSGTRHVAGWDERYISAGIPLHLLPDVVEGLSQTSDRYETDERKSEMRASCTCSPRSSAQLESEVDSLSHHGAYFYGK